MDKKMDKKIKLFTHNDLDGVSCVVLAQLKFKKENVDYEICSCNEINEKFKNFIETDEINKYDFVYMTDISINGDNAELITNYLIHNDTKFELIDHHKTAEFLNCYAWSNVAVEKKGIKQCGTSLFYKELNVYINVYISYFVELVRLYDTWDWAKDKNQDAKNLCDIFKMVGSVDFIEYYYKQLSSSITPSVLFPDKFMTALYYKRNEIDTYIKNKLTKIKIFIVCFEKKCLHYAVALCDRIDCTSELGNRILNDSDSDLSFVMLVYDGGVSLRSKKDFDVEILAKYFNGGGHKNAAGFRIDNPYIFFDIETSNMNKILKDLYNYYGIIKNTKLGEYGEGNE